MAKKLSTSQVFSVDSKVKRFPQAGGWVYISVPLEYSEITREWAVRGLVAIRATIGKSSWDTSLLPMGDGTHFIALNKKVLDAESIRVGDRIRASFRLRER